MSSSSKFPLPPTWNVSALAGTLKGSQNIPRISWQFGFQDVGAEPSTFQENATVTSEAAERQLCKTLQSNRLTTQHGEVYCQPGQYILFHSQVHTHMPCRGTEPEAAGPLEGEGSGGVGGKVPSCPGTEGSYKACSSTGPSRQAGWQGDLLHSACQRVIPTAR